jgi:allophanate hydrolase
MFTTRKIMEDVQLAALELLGPEQLGALLDRLHARAVAEQGRHAWITLASIDSIRSQFERAQAARAAGKALPLFGVPFAVKDNIDVAGFATTAACPAFAYSPESSAPSVQRLLDAGAICFGKTNLDQFATGLVGVRTPYGIPSSVFDETAISGGSSSGSAVAVARGLVSFALGTDTAGSGRVPAGFNHIVGLKPSRGLVSTRGVVPACRTLDSVSVFAGNAQDALFVLRLMAGFDAEDPYSRAAPSTAAPGPGFDAEHAFRFGVPEPEQLEFYGDDESRAAFERAVAALTELGGTAVRIDFELFLEAALLLYGGPWVAERYAAVGEFIEAQGEQGVDPTVRSIILGGKQARAVDVFRGHYRLEALRRATAPAWAAIDTLVLPTAPRSYSIQEVQRNPVTLNSNLGRYTNFVNLLDLCGVAVPAGMINAKRPFGVTLLGPAFQEAALCQLAARVQARFGEGVGNTGVAVRSPTTTPAETETIELAVVGAHLRGQPLHHQLTDLGARFVGAVHAAPRYRLFALDTRPPKPGLVRVPRAEPEIALEVYALSPEGFGRFVQQVPHPLCIGSLELADGRWVKGFLCEPVATESARDITAFGGWIAYLAGQE